MSRLGTVLWLLLVSLAFSPAMAQSTRPKVVVAPVVSSDVRSQSSFVGTVQPAKATVVGSAEAGRVVSRPVFAGEAVSAGDVLAQLRTERLQIQLAGAKAEVMALQRRLERLKNGARPEEIEASQAEKSAAEAKLEYAKARRQRVLLLQEKRAVGDDEVDAALAEARSAAEELASIDANLRLLMDGTREEEIAEAAARLEVGQQTVYGLEDRISQHRIVAPFDGYVVSEDCEVGQWVEQGDPVVRLVQLSEVDVHVRVPERHVAQLALGQPVMVTVPALEDTRFRGTLLRIIPEADIQTRSFPIRVRVKNQLVDSGPRLKAGMFAQVELGVGSAEDALMVPKDSLVLGGSSPVVFVLDEEEDHPPVARAVPVKLGVASGNLIRVTGNLRRGELVITEGNEGLRTGDSVEISARHVYAE